MHRDLSSRGSGQKRKGFSFRLWEMHSVSLLLGGLSRGSDLDQTRMGAKTQIQIPKMNDPAASSGVSPFLLSRHSVLDTESSGVFWIPASAGMTNSRQAAGNEPEKIQMSNECQIPKPENFNLVFGFDLTCEL